MTQKKFVAPAINLNEAIGRLDRALSEVLYLAQEDGLDAVDAMTLRHHADDCIGVGNKLLDIFEERAKAHGLQV